MPVARTTDPIQAMDTGLLRVNIHPAATLAAGEEGGMAPQYRAEARDQQPNPNDVVFS